MGAYGEVEAVEDRCDSVERAVVVAGFGGAGEVGDIE